MHAMGKGREGVLFFWEWTEQKIKDLCFILSLEKSSVSLLLFLMSEFLARAGKY